MIIQVISHTYITLEPQVIGPVRSLLDKRRNKVVMLMPLYPLGDLESVFEKRLPDIHRKWYGNPRVSEVRKLIADTMVRLLAEVHLTLTRLHGERIVHRDIKPGNILVRGRVRGVFERELYNHITSKVTNSLEHRW